MSRGSSGGKKDLEMNEKIVVFADGYDRVENPNITKDIQDFSLALNDLGELTGERLRTPARIIGELECY